MQLVLLTPPTTSPGEQGVVQQLFRAGGLETLHLRKPGASAEELAAYLGALPPADRRRVVLHSHHHLARSCSLKGIHYREADRPSGGIIAAFPGLTVSTSYHHLEQLGTCLGQLDYVFLSPVFDSISKAKDGYSAAFPNREQLSSHLSTSRYPVLALGGITPGRLAEVAELGFAGAALLGGVWQAADPVAAFREAQRECERLGGLA